jgi:hypothetical protein
MIDRDGQSLFDVIFNGNHEARLRASPPASSICLPIANLVGLTMAAPKRGRGVLESNKIAGDPMSVFRRQEQIGSFDATSDFDGRPVLSSHIEKHYISFPPLPHFHSLPLIISPCCPYLHPEHALAVAATLLANSLSFAEMPPR